MSNIPLKDGKPDFEALVGDFFTPKKRAELINIFKALYETGFVDGFNGCETSLVPRQRHDALDEAAKLIYKNLNLVEMNDSCKTLDNAYKAIRALMESAQ